MGASVVSRVLICSGKGPSVHPRTDVLMNSRKHFCKVDSEHWDCWVNSHELLKFSDNLSNYVPEKCTLPAKSVRESLSLSMPMSVLDHIRLFKFPLCCMGKGKLHCFDLYVFKWVWTSCLWTISISFLLLKKKNVSFFSILCPWFC